MAKKRGTVEEMARMGGLAREYSEAQIRAWGRMGGRPPKLDAKSLAQVEAMLAGGKTHGECAEILGVSAPTIARTLVRDRSSNR